MELKLTRPICFFDLETTGIDVAKDRIVEIAIFKVFPNGNKESKTWLVNPTIPIPPQSTAIHGISDEKVANEPTFKELSSQIYNMIKDADLAGYNSDRFDIPLLAEEMQSLENAHSAEADTMATYEIMKAQLDRYPELENDMKSLSEFTTRKKIADFAGMIAFDADNDEVFTFGKHKGVKVDVVLENEPGYFSWIQNADFPLYTKKVLTGIKLRKLNTK